VREVDIVARLGGDEFTIVLTRVESVRDVGQVAQQLIKVLSKAFEIDGQKLYVGASVGIAMYPEDADGGSDLLKKADTAMYRAKELGRGRFAFFEERMNADLKRRATLDRELRSALENGEFVLRFQPQIDLSNGQLCCAEALIRWQHPVHGLLGPIDFIPIAEDCGLIDTIGAWVLKEACAQMVRWRTEGVPIPRVSVNVSNRQLRRADFVRAVDYILVSIGLPPDCLEIEVTESLFLEGGKAAVDTLRSLENAGVVVAIDDFGTGYSSFSYLRTLPASVLKLDKSFIADVVTDKDAGTIAAAIVNMAHTLRKQVVAEGVETEEQLAFLRQLGCEKVQGFLFSRPLPALRIAEFARKRQAEVGTPLPSPEEFDAEAGQETVVGKLLAA
jgi:predicted signal transduction protein with EAL and GGDEF domain